MKKVLVLFVCLLLAQVRVMAQDIQVQPSPRQVNVTGKSMTIPVAFRLVGEQEANPHAIALLKQFLGDRLGTEGFSLYVGEKGDRAVRGAKRLIPVFPVCRPPVRPDAAHPASWQHVCQSVLIQLKESIS